MCNSNRNPILIAVSVSAMVLATSGCGEGGSAGAGSPIAVAPPPAPTPSPTPAPTPSPTPSAPRLLGATPGQQLVGQMACARDEAIFDAQGRLTGLRSLSEAKIDSSLRLTYRGADSFALDVNGFGGSAFVPADKVISSNRAHSQFLNPAQGEFFLLKDGVTVGTRTFTTLGLDNSAGLCFFAVGRPADGLPTVSTDEHFLLTDGAGRVGGRMVRLFGHNGKMDVAAQTREATLEIRLAGSDDPFGDFTLQPAREITVARTTLRYDGSGSFSLTPLSATNGYSGTISGIFTTPQADAVGGSGAGAVFTFELRNAQGDVLFGAIASEANRI